MTTINTPADTARTLAFYSLADVNTVASIIHGEAWASLYEECGGSLSGCEITEVMPSIPAQAMTLALWVLVQAEAAGDRPDTAPAADIGFEVVGSGGGSDAPVRLEMYSPYLYYIGNAGGPVYLWCEASPFGERINGDEVADSCRDFDIPVQMTVEVCVTYEIVTGDSSDEGDAAERGFVLGVNDLPDEGRVGASAEAWQNENGVREQYLLPRDAEELRELARGRTVSVRSETVVEADGVQSPEDGAWRSETLHIEAAGNLDADDVKAWTEVVMAALRLR